MSGPARASALDTTRPGALPAAALIVAVTLPLFLLGLGDRNIWTPLEARYALVAREMLDGGHWILPHLGGRVYADKPPLLFWWIALLGAAGSGVTEWTARLPSVIAGVLTCLLTWRLGARLFAPPAGLLAALVLATSAAFFWSARQVLPDMLLTLWIAGACWGLWEWLVTKRPRGAILAGVFMGLATLAKGPVGFLLPVLTALVYLVARRDWRAARGREGSLCAAAFLATALAWYLPAVWQGGLPYVRETLFHHSVERYVSAWEHKAPFYFYLAAFPAEFMPWILFLPPALARVGAPLRGEERRGWWFCVSWLLTPLVFFSFSSAKRDVYILPAYPAAALLVGWIWSRWWAGFARRAGAWGMLVPAVLLGLGLVGLGVAVAVGAGAALPLKAILLSPASPAGLGAVVFLGLIGIGLMIAARARASRWVFGCVAGGAWLAMLVTGGLLHPPEFNQRYPIRAFARAVSGALDPGAPLSACGPVNDLGLSFNLGRVLPLLPSRAEVARYLDSADPVYCVMDRRAYAGLVELTGRRFPVLVEQEFDRGALLLVSNRREGG